MPILKLIKNNEYKVIPLKPDTDILFNKKIAEILDFDKTSNTYSYTIAVPETPEVNAILEWANDYTHNSAFRAVNIPAILESSGIPLKGFLKVTGHEGKYYQTQFVSGTFSWWVEIAERKLCQLGFDDDLYLNKTFLESVFAPSGTGADDTAPYVDGDLPVWASLKCFGAWQTNFVRANEMQYDFYARAIVNKIFAASTFNLSSSFLSSAFFRKVLVWISPPAITNSDSFMFYGEQTDTAYDVAFAFITYKHLVNQAGNLALYNNSTGVFTIPVTGTYKLTLEYSVLVTGTTASNFLVNFYHDDETNMANSFVPGPSSIACPLGVTMSGTLTLEVGYVAGQSNTFIRGGVFYDQSPGAQSMDVVVTIITKYRIELMDEEVEYSNIGAEAVLKAHEFIKCDYTVGEFLKGIIQAFNLQVATDVNSRTVTIEPYNDFYLGNSDYEEWTEIVDAPSIKKTFVNELKKNSVLKFKDDSNDKRSKDLYLYTHTATKRYEEGEYKSENPFFSATDNITDTTIATSVLIPVLMNGDIVDNVYPDKSYDFLPRLFYKLGYQEYTGEDWDWATAGNTLSRIPKALQVGQGAELGFNTALFADYYARNFQDLESADKLSANVAIDFNRFVAGNFRKPKMIRENGQVMYYRLLVMEGFDANEKKLTDCVFQVWKR